MATPAPRTRTHFEAIPLPLRSCSSPSSSEIFGRGGALGLLTTGGEGDLVTSILLFFGESLKGVDFIASTAASGLFGCDLGSGVLSLSAVWGKGGAGGGGGTFSSPSPLAAGSVSLLGFFENVFLMFFFQSLFGALSDIFASTSVMGLPCVLPPRFAAAARCPTSLPRLRLWVCLASCHLASPPLRVARHLCLDFGYGFALRLATSLRRRCALPDIFASTSVMGLPCVLPPRFAAA